MKRSINEMTPAYSSCDCINCNIELITGLIEELSFNDPPTEPLNKKQKTEEKCKYCNEINIDCMLPMCDHKFHTKCILELNYKCPVCV
jgi:hypothetical protein